MNITAVNLQRRIQEPRKLSKNIFREEGTGALEKALGRMTPTLSLPVMSNNRQLPGALTDLDSIDLDTDQGPWLEWRNDAAAGKRYLTVMHLCDIYFPYPFDLALDVTYPLIRHLNPDLIVGGSAAADFALISSFDPDLNEATSDVLDEFEEHWNPFVHKVREAAPNAVLVWIGGNHERRMKHFLNKQAPKFRKRILHDFIEVIRCGKGVLYLGDTDYVRAGPLVVHHGRRTGFYAAKNSLLDVGGQLSMMGGHVHYPSEYDIQGEDFRVRRIVSGCRCAYPHYMTGVRMTKPLQLGTGVGEIDLRGRDVVRDERI